MGLFNFRKKEAVPAGPYREEAANKIYELLFCDDPELLKSNIKPPYAYPLDVLFDESPKTTDLQKIIADDASEPRIKLLAANRLLATGEKPAKELLAVIVEVGLDGGLDVLASFQNGTARYINYTGQMIIWENTDDAAANALKDDLFKKSEAVVKQIGPWDQPRKPYPAKGNVRLSFLLTDGLYFGEGPMNVLFNDPLAGAPLNSATRLMQYLMEQSKKP